MKKFLLCRIVLLCFALSVTAKDKVEFKECSYLHKEESQSNAYYTDAGHPCCLCWKGTYWTGDCTSTENIRETQCEPCVYNNITKTYRDFGPHKENKCEVEQYCSAGAGLLSVGGSASEKNRCECAVGFNKIEFLSNHYRCDELIAETTTPNTKAVVKTNEIEEAVDKNVVVSPTAKDKTDVVITAENNEKDQKIVDSGYPDPEINREDQEIVVPVSPEVDLTHVPSNTTIYISNEDENQPDKFSTMHVIASIFGGFCILALIILIFPKKNRTYFLKRVKSFASEPGDVVIYDPQRLSPQHDTSLTAHSQSEELNHFVDAAEPNDVRSLLPQSANTEPDGPRDTAEPNAVRSSLPQSANTGPDDPSDISEPHEGQSLLSQSTNNGSSDPGDHNFYLIDEGGIGSENFRINIDDVEAEQQDVAQVEDSDTLSSVVVMETPESYRELETQKNMAGPIDSDNRNGVVRESSEVSSNNLGTTVDASNQQQLGTDFALQGSSLTQQNDPRISPNHKKFRLIAVENIADIITQPDRMSFGHFLIPNDNELDLIIKLYIGDGHMEVSRRVFIRGFQLKPNLSLYELRDEAERLKLGYLEDKFKEQIEQLDIVPAQEE